MADPIEDDLAAARTGSAKAMASAMVWVIAGGTGVQPGTRFKAMQNRQVFACSLCCTPVACNGSAMRQGVVTGSTADSDDASSTTQRLVNHHGVRQ